MLNFTYDQLITNIDIVFGNFPANIKYDSVAAIATPVLIIAGTYMVFRYAKNSQKRSRRYEFVYSRSMSLGALHGGKLALQRLIDYHHARADSASLNAAETELRTLLAQDQPDFNKLQSTVAKLEMAGKEGVAVGLLEKGVRKAKSENRSHEAYEVEMLLVEALIYKGDYRKALNCECLNYEEISDARRPLYKVCVLDQKRSQP
ncbi:uncharacterized protein [Euphorbia lathyris]|uniref:uncharacterized protein isoform X2 n=1 Tax=Euphorbia lathyris TaxID=212925 RepID=UPI003313F628